MDNWTLLLTIAELAGEGEEARAVAVRLSHRRNQMPSEGKRLLAALSPLVNRYVTARREGGLAVISVTDNGIGIARENLHSVFDMFVQVDGSIERSQGGQVAVANGKVKAKLSLRIAGLVSDQPLHEVRKRIDALNTAAHTLGCDLDAPFMTLSFLSLSPIPQLRLTDQGLIDAVHLRKTTLFA